MTVVDPLQHPKWNAWVERFPSAHFFHGQNWAQVLRDTYGHTPLYLCELSSDGITAALPLMEVRSALTGRRGVSIPFTDFCPALGAEEGRGRELVEAAMAEGRRRGWRYYERRNGSDGGAEVTPSLSFWGHEVDLTSGAEKMFEKMDSSGRRAIRKAEKANFKVEFERSEEAMAKYFEMHCQTRRGHGLPPQPWKFFANIQKCMMAGGYGEIGLVYSEGKAVAGAVYFWIGKKVMYKFGASDSEARAERPNNLLMWKAMERYGSKGFEALHLGRTSLIHDGLRRFKLGFGAREERIDFCKFDFKKGEFLREEDKVEGWFNRVFEKMPEFALRLAGKMLYPHLS